MYVTGKGAGLEGSANNTDPMVSPLSHRIEIDGRVLQRGFWLYVWEIDCPSGEMLLYVGRTGDKPSKKAQSPFNRVGQHLGFNRNDNALRRHLEKRDIKPEECSFRHLSEGPFLGETKDQIVFDDRVDRMAACEKSLAEWLVEAGYPVINDVQSKKSARPGDLAAVRSAFAEHFPELGAKRENVGTGAH